MDELDLLIDLHIDGERQGPGSDDVTRAACALSGLASGSDLQIADLGCGTGVSTLVLADELDCHVTAVDFLQPFLDRLDQTARQRGCSDRITTYAASIDALPFGDASLDAIWSEGAIYNIGFTAGIAAWRRFLRPGGVIAVSEITWLTDQRPAELEEHWMGQYPEIATASTKFAQLEQAGYTPIGYLALDESCWFDHYYRPMQARFPSFLDRHDHSPDATAIVEAEQAEIDLYERFSSHFSYGFYIARRTAGPPAARAW